jgi:steroid delta-isomerase-like uncharacterized protein
MCGLKKEERMSIEENKELLRRYFEQANEIEGDINKVRIFAKEFLAPEFVSHHSQLGDMNSEQYVKIYIEFFTAFPNLNYSVVNMIAEEDKVAVQWMTTGTHKGEFLGIPPTGKEIRVMGFALYRIANDKLVEIWALVDSLTQMQQLGVIPSK